MSNKLPIKSMVLYGTEERTRHEAPPPARTFKDLLATQTVHLGTIHFEITPLGVRNKPPSDMRMDRGSSS